MALCNHGDIWPVSSGKQKKTPSTTTSTARRRHAESLESTSAQSCIQHLEVQPQRFEKQKNPSDRFYSNVFESVNIQPSGNRLCSKSTRRSRGRTLHLIQHQSMMGLHTVPQWRTWSLFCNVSSGFKVQSTDSRSFPSAGPWRHHFHTSLHTELNVFTFLSLTVSEWSFSCLLSQHHLFKNNFNTVKRKSSTWTKWFIWLNYFFFFKFNQLVCFLDTLEEDMNTHQSCDAAVSV